MAKAVKKQSKKNDWDLNKLFVSRVAGQLSGAGWILRITERSNKPSPVFLIKERLSPQQRDDTEGMVAPRSVLKERGLIYGEQQLRVLPVIASILSRIQDKNGVPLELQRFVAGPRILFRGNLPLDDEAGCKLALIFKLQERILELNRVELLARRIERFTREEAAYWYSRISSYGSDANRWATAGMKTLLAGQPKDKAVETMLEKLRNNT